MTQHAPRRKEHNNESEENNQYRPKEKAQPQVVEDPQFIPLGESKIDQASIIHAIRCNSERHTKPAYIKVRRLVGSHPLLLNCVQSFLAVARSNPQFQRTIGAFLKEKHRVICSSLVASLVRNFLACKFCNLADNPLIESVLGRALGHIAQGFYLSCKPGIAPALDVLGDKAVKENEDNRCSKGKGQGGPE